MRMFTGEERSIVSTWWLLKELLYFCTLNFEESLRLCWLILLIIHLSLCLSTLFLFCKKLTTGLVLTLLCYIFICQYLGLLASKATISPIKPQNYPDWAFEKKTFLNSECGRAFSFSAVVSTSLCTKSLQCKICT